MKCTTEVGRGPHAAHACPTRPLTSIPSTLPLPLTRRNGEKPASVHEFTHIYGGGRRRMPQRLRLRLRERRSFRLLFSLCSSSR